MHDLAGLYSDGQEPMCEPALAILAADLLRAVGALHAADVLHCDVRPRNVSLRAEPGTTPRCGDRADTRVTCGCFGVALLDLGRAIDRRQYDRGVRFSGDVMAEGYECVEMRRRTCWTVQIDCYAAAGTIDAMLHAHCCEQSNTSPSTASLKLSIRQSASKTNSC